MRTTDEALAELRAELALWGPEWHVTEIAASRGWATFNPAHEHKPNVGAWRETIDHWCVTAEQDGWDAENGRHFEWAKSIAEAALNVRDAMKRRREDPHYGHILDHWVLPDCADCANDVTTLGLQGEKLPVLV